MIKIYAEHDPGERMFIWDARTLEEAKAVVLSIDDNQWPEGCDAVAVDGEKEYFLVEDKWEPIE